MSATYEQAQQAQPVARALFNKIVPVLTVAIVRVGSDGFGLRVDVKESPRLGSAPATVEGVPVQLRVSSGRAVAQPADE